MYLSYVEYQDYGGTLDETTFNEFEFEARSIIDYYTFNRLQNDTIFSESIKRLVYALISLAQKKEASMSLGISNTSGESSTAFITRQENDGVSTTYSSMSAATLFDLCKKEAESVVGSYLNAVVNEAGQKVLYRGLYPGE